MVKTKHILIVSLTLLSLTAISGIILSSSSVSADDVVDQVNITVPESCTMSGTGTNTHNAEINNGTYNSNIGTTTIKAFCNDNEGFAIYAIGYTDNEDGKNVLTDSTLGSTHDIVTGTATSGNISNWAMKLSTVSSPTPTYPIVIAGTTEDALKEQGDPDYSSFQEVPDDYTKVAYRTSSTDVGASAEGATLTTTYQAYISATQSAGTYTGQVKYTLVHPHNSTAPQKPISIEDALAAAGKQKYNGYYKIQDIDSIICEAANVIETDGTVEVIDVRDNTIYKITKLKDNRCWMLDNLALDPTDSTTAANLSVNNTNATSEAIANYLNGGNPDNIDGWSSDAVINTNSISPQSETKPELTNQYKNLLVTSYGPASVNGQAKAGIYYSYCAATIGTYCKANRMDIPDTLIDAPYDICPANWRMPTGGHSGEYGILIQDYDSTTDATDPNSLQYNLSTPLSGGYIMGSWSSQNNYGMWLSSTVSDNNDSSSYMFLLTIYPTSASDSSVTYRNFGVPMRCIVK